MDTLKKFGKTLTSVSRNKNLMILLGSILVSILIGYLLSKKFRSGLALKNFRLFPQTTIQRGTDYCLDYFENRGLADFHVFSSALSGSVGFTKYDYLSFAFLKEIVRSGVRYVEFTIMASDESSNAKPVISLQSGKKQNKTSINVLPCDDTFAALSKIVFSRMHLVNYTDPFFVYLNIQTDKPQVQDKLNKILLSTFSDKMLPNSLRYEKANLGVVPVCELTRKIVFFCNATHPDSKLKECISTPLGKYLKRIPYSDLLLPSRHGSSETPDFFIESKNISFHEGIGDPYIVVHDDVNFMEQGLSKEMKINITGSNLAQNNTLNADGEPFYLTIKQITPKKIVFDEHRVWKPKGTRQGDTINIRGFLLNKTREGLEDYNRTALTIVIPDENIFANNFNPKNAWYLGCQFVALYFQTTDENWKKSKYFFRKRAIRMKQNTLLRSLKGSAGEKVETEKGIPLALFEEPKADPQFSIDHSIYKKVLGRNVIIEPLLNNKLKSKKEKEVRLIKSDKLAKLGLFESTNSVFNINPSGTYNNSGFITIRLGDKYLSFNPRTRSLEWIENKCGGNILEKSNFMKKTNFIIERESIPNSNAYQIAYIEQIKEKGDQPARKQRLYLTYSQKYAPSKMIYTKDTDKYEKISSFTMNDGRNVTIWRPIPSMGFLPIGDVAVISSKEILTEMPTKKAILVNGAITSPMDYELIWDNKQSQLANPDSKPISFWRPIPPENHPQGAFQSLGIIVTTNYVKPDTNTFSICCVSAKYTEEADFGSGRSSVGKYKRLTEEGQVKDIEFWRSVNEGYNYFVISYVENKEQESNPKPPSERDFPLRIIKKNTNSSTIDRITLQEDGNMFENHFKIKLEAKGGYQPIDQGVYDTIASLPKSNQKFKTKLSVNYPSGEARCLSIPDGYWNKSLSETRQFGSTPQTNNNRQKTTNIFYDILPKDECAGSKEMLDFYAEEEVCNSLGAHFSRDRLTTDGLHPCSLVLCKKNTEELINRYSVVRKGECPNNSSKGQINLEMSNDKCRSLGGMIVDRDGTAFCNFEICNETTPNEMIISKENDTIKKSFKDEGASVNPIKMQPCLTDNLLDTNYKYSTKDNKIRSTVNPRYCVTADKKENKDEYNLYLQLCRNNNPLQEFTYNDQKQIISNSLQTDEGVRYCVNANFDDTTSMKPCDNPVPTRQKWELNSQSRNYCIKKGMSVLVLQTEPRQDKTEGITTPFSPPIDNLLSEDFDDKNFHYWVKGRVTDIKNGKYNVKLNYGEDEKYATLNNRSSVISVTSNKIVPDLDLRYQLNEKPKKGDVVLVKNRGIYINQDNNDIYVQEENIYWKGVILNKVKNIDNLYKVALSINSIEPNPNKKLKGRDSQTGVKNISIDNMRFLRFANICESSIEL